MRSRTIHNVQYLRFFAASAVLFSHTADLVVSHYSPVWKVPWTAGVDVFFVIRGFIMTWLTRGRFGAPDAPLRYLLSRIIRIAPPYWFFTAVMVAAVLLAPEQVRNTRLGWTELITSALFIAWPRADGHLSPIVSQGWTLNFEAFFYVSFAIALASRRGFRILIVGFFVLTAVHILVPAKWFVLHFYSSPIILEFTGGMVIGQLYLSGVRLPSFAPMLGALVAGLWFLRAQYSQVTEWSSDYWGFGRVILCGVPAFILAGGFILAPDRSWGRIGRFFRVGGDSSYTLYLSHPLCVHAIVILARSMGWRNPWLILAAASGSAIAFAILFYRFIEAPVTRQLARTLGSDRDSRPASVAP